MGGSMDTILNDQGSANTGQSGHAGGANGQKQFQITPEEVIRMKDILEQRDAEITVLVSFFQKSEILFLSSPHSFLTPYKILKNP